MVLKRNRTGNNQESSYSNSRKRKKVAGSVPFSSSSASYFEVGRSEINMGGNGKGLRVWNPFSGMRRRKHNKKNNLKKVSQSFHLSLSKLEQVSFCTESNTSTSTSFSGTSSTSSSSGDSNPLHLMGSSSDNVVLKNRKNKKNGRKTNSFDKPVFVALLASRNAVDQVQMYCERAYQKMVGKHIQNEEDQVCWKKALSFVDVAYHLLPPNSKPTQRTQVRINSQAKRVTALFAISVHKRPPNLKMMNKLIEKDMVVQQEDYQFSFQFFWMGYSDCGIEKMLHLSAADELHKDLLWIVDSLPTRIMRENNNSGTTIITSNSNFGYRRLALLPSRSSKDSPHSTEEPSIGSPVDSFRRYICSEPAFDTISSHDMNDDQEEKEKEEEEDEESTSGTDTNSEWYTTTISDSSFSSTLTTDTDETGITSTSSESGSGSGSGTGTKLRATTPIYTIRSNKPTKRVKPVVNIQLHQQLYLFSIATRPVESVELETFQQRIWVMLYALVNIMYVPSYDEYIKTGTAEDWAKMVADQLCELPCAGPDHVKRDASALHFLARVMGYCTLQEQVKFVHAVSLMTESRIAVFTHPDGEYALDAGQAIVAAQQQKLGDSLTKKIQNKYGNTWQYDELVEQDLGFICDAVEEHLFMVINTAVAEIKRKGDKWIEELNGSILQALANNVVEYWKRHCSASILALQRWKEKIDAEQKGKEEEEEQEEAQEQEDKEEEYQTVVKTITVNSKLPTSQKFKKILFQKHR